MADQTQPANTSPSRQPSTTALALMIALTMLALLLLGWIWYTRYAPVHYDLGGSATITDAEGARYILPGILAGLVIIAAAWIATWLIARWKITFLPIAVGVFGLLALIFFGIELRQSLNTRHDISVLIYTCEGDAERIGARTDLVPEGCDDMVPSKATVTIGTSSDPGMFRRDENANTSHRFSDLPEGTYNGLITTTARPKTAEVVLAADTSNGIRPVAPLRHNEGDTWSSPIALHPDLEDYYLLLYTSPYDEAPDAHIRFSMQQCTGTSLTDFDASACEPATLSGPIVEEEPPAGDVPAGRPSAIAIDTASMNVTNLEARTYTFSPVMSRGALASGSGGVLVIPADAPQTSDNSVLEISPTSPQGTVTIDVPPDAGEMHYIVYVFADNSPTIATTGPHIAAVLPGVRP